MILIYFIFSLSAWASSTEVKDLFEKTFPRDNTFCQNSKQRIEIIIRGETKYNDPIEKGFGEFFFVKDLSEKLFLLELNKGRSDSYKLFLGKGSECSKSFGYKIGDDTLAVLLLKENKPFKEKLVIQFFDYKSLIPKEFLETNYLTDKVKKTSNGFAFNTFSERYESEIGKVTINDVPYTYQDRDFPQWMGYSPKGFETLPDMTFAKLPWKKSFSDEADFLSFSAWDSKEKNFKNKFLYIAVNHSLKKGCILFLSERKKPTGSDPWRCQTL